MGSCACHRGCECHSHDGAVEPATQMGLLSHTIILITLQAQSTALFGLQGLGVALAIPDVLRTWPATPSCPSKASGTQSHTKG